MRTVRLIIYGMTLMIFALSCSYDRREVSLVNSFPDISPDYKNVTIPVNICPLNFKVNSSCDKAVATFSCAKSSMEIKSSGNEIRIPINEWKTLLSEACSDSITITLDVKQDGKWNRYKDFSIYVSSDSIDPYIAYRLIEPGYALWNNMGIYQRNLETFEQSVIYENKTTDYNCVNCHSFCAQSPDKMLFHLRTKKDGTVFVDNGSVELVDTRSDKTMSALVYPSWHPSGNYIAFSVNKTTQFTHQTNRTEVYDNASDVVIYDVRNKNIITNKELMSENLLETFPTFSSEGNKLIYCCAEAVQLPDSIASLRYNILCREFDQSTGSVSAKVDTIYNAVESRKSASFPRISPDGKYILFTTADYGTFPIWHKESDLCMLNLENMDVVNMDMVNSDDTESYHSWSSNGKWVVFSSRRLDGLYTRPYITFVTDSGLTKPFLLPQKRADYYEMLTKSYNIPEFIIRKVDNLSDKIYRLN